MYEEAGEIYAEQKMFEDAARCYLKVKMWHEAGKFFEEAKKYDDAALAYKDGCFYEIASDCILRYKKEIDRRTFRHVSQHVKIHYHATAILRGTFDEAIDMYIKLIDNDDDIIETLRFLLYPCKINILEETMIRTTSPSNLREHLSKANKFTKENELQSTEWKSLIEEFWLYSAYLEKDLDKAYRGIQFFKRIEDLVTEFHAVNIWLRIHQQSSAKYWHDRLQYLQWMFELVFSFIKVTNTKKFNPIKKNFEEIFCVNETNNPQKRQIPFSNALLDSLNKMQANDKNFYDANDIHQKISQFLVSHIIELIHNADQNGRNIPDISSQICYEFTSCQNPDCRDHHVVPTPSILYQRLTLAKLQYTLMLNFDVDLLEHHRLLENEQSEEIRDLQKWWAERLVKIHIHYQSPHISCPEVTYMVLSKLPEQIHNKFIDHSYNTWSVNFNDFEVMLKYMFIFQRLQDRWGINKFNWKMANIQILSKNSNLSNLPVGFVFHIRYNKAIPVGNRLSSFFFHLYFNDLINAISNIKIFIQYAINNTKRVNLVTSDGFGDLVSLMEFATSLVFAISPGNCDFFLPRAYLVNYFEAFTAEPLLPSQQHNYDRENYLNAIKNSFDQIQQLLDMICKEQIYMSVILRLIRLLILIRLNEPTFATEVITLFKSLNHKVTSLKIKKYLEERSTEQLVNFLHNDLNETGCDSLVIVYYDCKDLSKFSNLEKNGITKLTYKSDKEFNSALQKIKPLIDQKRIDSIENKLQIWFHKIRDSPKETRKIQGWYRRVKTVRKIKVWLHLLYAAKNIQVWIRRVFKRIKSRDPILNKIYNDMIKFCKIITEEVKNKSVYKYNILLKGQTVDVVVKLIKLYRQMNYFINNCSSNTNKNNRRLELENELKFVKIN
ncbi:hypothetical protein C1645_227689 [Glomus cerebriforme]|uniref:Uncharacterized protein n=1 Tax=Glomus cerebriforme TaxID=658196 RepID=A0A397TS79_9GLOM|nr:hypothetical protein C1645_227689 [Glomus cerebriforme]